MLPSIDIEDPFEQKFGTLSEKQKTRIRRVLRWFILGLREVLNHQDTQRMLRLVPEMKHMSPCESCAFVPTIDSLPTFPGTIYGMLKMVLAPNKIFVCHGNQTEWNEGKVDPSRVIFCKGYMSLLLLNSKTVILYAIRAQAVIDRIAKQ